MPSETLTERQRKVLDFVQGYVDGHGFPPTLREIGDAVGIASLNAVRGHLAALEKKGLDREVAGQGEVDPDSGKEEA